MLDCNVLFQPCAFRVFFTSVRVCSTYVGSLLLHVGVQLSVEKRMQVIGRILRGPEDTCNAPALHKVLIIKKTAVAFLLFCRRPETRGRSARRNNYMRFGFFRNGHAVCMFQGGASSGSDAEF